MGTPAAHVYPHANHTMCTHTTHAHKQILNTKFSMLNSKFSPLEQSLLNTLSLRSLLPDMDPLPENLLAGVKARRILRVVLAVEMAASAGLALWHNTWENAVVCLLLMVGLPLLWLTCYCFVLKKLRVAAVRVCAVGEALLAIQIGLWAYVLYFHAGDGLGLGWLLIIVGVGGQFTWLFLMLILQLWVTLRHPRRDTCGPL